MPGCAAVGCNNRSEKGFTMKCFPRDRTLRNIWKQRVGRADWEPSNNSFLCHVHFEPSQWIITPGGRIKLKKGAIPSIFTVTSTRKSPKKRQKLKKEKMSEVDLEEYEVEYLEEYEEDNSPFITNLDNERLVPDPVSPQPQNAISSGQILQNIKMLSGDALRNLQNENVIIVADENNREIGKIINDSFILFHDESGKENVQIISNPKSAEVKLEIKEELLENGLNSHDFDEIERKLQEIHQDMHHSEEENEEDDQETQSSENNRESLKITSNHSIETESSCALDDFQDDLDVRENSNQVDSDASLVQIGVKRKRLSTVESINGEHIITSSQTFKKSNEIQFIDDANNIIHDLEADASIDSDLSHVNNISSESIASDHMNRISKPIENNTEIHLQIVKRKSDQNATNRVDNKKSRDVLIDKLNVQGEVIERLSNDLIMYKDMERKMKVLTQELQNKNIELEKLRKVAAKKSVSERKSAKNDIDLKNASEEDLRNRIEVLEEKNKQLTKNVSLEIQNRRKLDCQVRSRDSQIKELNWKLEKASKFLDRAEKNANTYKKKMNSMTSIVRRKKLLNINETNSIFDELLVCQSNQDFTDTSLKTALDIEKACGMEGYQKLLNYEFPLPALKVLSEKFPTEIDYFELDDKPVTDNAESDAYDDQQDSRTSTVDVDNIEYLELSTVQNIFDENCDSDEDLDLDELKKHIVIDAEDDS